jgi:hypothetical protein
MIRLDDNVDFLFEFSFLPFLVCQSHKLHQKFPFACVDVVVMS